MFNLIRYFLFTILFTSMGFGFIVGDWNFDRDTYPPTNTVYDDSNSNLDGDSFSNAVATSTERPNNFGKSVLLSNQGDHLFLPSSDKIILDSGKVSFWFRPTKLNASRHGLFSKDHGATATAGHLTMMLSTKWTTGGDPGYSSPRPPRNGDYYLHIRLQAPTSNQSSDNSYFLVFHEPIQINQWYFVEFIYGDSKDGMYANLYKDKNDNAHLIESVEYKYYGGMGNILAYDQNGVERDIAGNHESIALGATSYQDGRGDSNTEDWNQYYGYLDGLKWETYEKPVIVHRFDACDIFDTGVKLLNFAKNKNGLPSNSSIKGNSSVTPGKICSGVDTSTSPTDYIDIDTSLINGLIDFSLSLWVKTKKNGDIVTTNNKEIRLSLENNTIIAYVKNIKYTFSTADIKDDQWHQLVLTRKTRRKSESHTLEFPEQARITLYLDGNLVESQITKDQISPLNINWMHIGEGNTKAQIDEFLFFENQLSSTSVELIYKAHTSQPPKSWDGKEERECPKCDQFDGNITINDVSLLEGNNGDLTDFIFTVSLSEANERTIYINYTIEDGSAYVSNSDYKTADKLYTGTIEFSPSLTASTNTITVQVIGDNRVEPDEDFTITLDDPGFGNMIKSVGRGTIENDDNLSMLSINDVNGTEGDAFNFTITLSKAYPEAVTVNYHTHPTEGSATSDKDYNAKSGEITIPANSLTATVTIQTIDDDEVEPTEDFYVILDNPSDNVTIADNEGKGLILDNDESFLSISDYKDIEGNSGTKIFTFDVNLSTKVSQEVTVNYTIADLTASSKDEGVLGDNDYNKHEPITITFAPGEQSKTIEIEVNGDLVVEEDEKFKITISTDSDKVTLQDAEGIGTIINDDSSSLSINDIKKKEGDAGTTTPFEFTISLNIPNTKEVKVDYVLVDATAEKGSDYNDTNGTATIAIGDLNTTITVNVIGDNLVEPNEDFYVILSNPINSSISDNNGTGTIENDDNITIEINDVNLTEGNLGLKDFNFTVTLTKPHTKAIKLQYYTQETALDYNATETVDYEKIDKTPLTFEAGEIGPKTITVHVIGDENIENNETFHVILEAIGALPSDTYLTDKGLGTIINDDFGYPINKITFNIERTNTRGTDNATINTDARNAWYTQVSGRTFAYDVVCYDVNLTHEYPLKNVVVKIDLMDNNESIDTQYAYFESNSSRAKVRNLVINEASKDARFVVSVLHKGSLIYKHHCVGITAEACYESIITDPLIGKNQHAAKDNFAIRPAGFSYGIKGSTDTLIIDNSTANDSAKHLAAGLSYTFIAKALSYDSEYTDKLEGYVAEAVERKIEYALEGKSCNDTEDRSDTVTFNQGTVHNASFDINQTAKYTLSIVDENWTKVDQNGHDCTAGKSDIKDGVNDIQGCNTDSKTKIHDVDYTDQTITVHPHHFTVTIEESSDPENLEVIYMNSITATNTKMSKQLDINITAQSFKDNNLTNFTNGCMAANLKLDYNITTNPSWNDINDSNEANRYLYVTVNNTELQKITSKQTFDQNGIKKDAFDAGIAKIEVNYNIDRDNTATVNPVVVTFESLNVKSPSIPYNKSADEEVIPKGSSTSNIQDTFLYARVRAEEKVFRQERRANNVPVSTPLFIDVYCSLPNNFCLNRDINNPRFGDPLYGIRTNQSTMGWYMATHIDTINTNQAALVTLTTNDNITINNANGIEVPNLTDRNDDLAPINARNLTPTVTCPAANLIADVTLDPATSDWLIYDNDPLFQVRCDNLSAWGGKGNSGTVIGETSQNAAAAILPGANAGLNSRATSLKPTNRLSW